MKLRCTWTTGHSEMYKMRSKDENNPYKSSAVYGERIGRKHTLYKGTGYNKSKRTLESERTGVNGYGNKY